MKPSAKSSNGAPVRRVRIVEPPASARASQRRKRMARETSPLGTTTTPTTTIDRSVSDVDAFMDWPQPARSSPRADTVESGEFLSTPLHPGVTVIDESSIFESIERAVHQTLRGARESLVSEAQSPSQRYHAAKSANVWDEDSGFEVTLTGDNITSAAAANAAWPVGCLPRTVPEVHEAAELVRELHSMKLTPLKLCDDVANPASALHSPLDPLVSSSSPDTLVDILDAIDRRAQSPRHGSRDDATDSVCEKDGFTAHSRAITDVTRFDPNEYAMALFHHSVKTRGNDDDDDDDVGDEQADAARQERELIATYFPELALSADATDAASLHASLDAALRTLRKPILSAALPSRDRRADGQPCALSDILEGEDPEEVRRLLHFSLSAQPAQPAAPPSTSVAAAPAEDAQKVEEAAAHAARRTDAARRRRTEQAQRQMNEELVQQIVAALPAIPDDVKAELSRQRRLLEHLTEVQQAHLRRLARQQQEETRRRIQAPLSDATMNMFPGAAASRKLGLDKVVEPFIIGQQLQRVASTTKQPLPPLITITTAPAHVSADELAEREAKFYEKEMARLRDDYGAMLEREKTQRMREQRAFREALEQQQASLLKSHREALGAVQREARQHRQSNENLAFQLAAAQEVVHRADTRQLLDHHEKKTAKMLRGTVEAIQSYTAAAAGAVDAGRRTAHGGGKDDVRGTGPAPDLSRPRYEASTGHHKLPRPRRTQSVVGVETKPHVEKTSTKKRLAKSPDDSAKEVSVAIDEEETGDEDHRETSTAAVPVASQAPTVEEEEASASVSVDAEEVDADIAEASEGGRASDDKAATTSESDETSEEESEHGHAHAELSPAADVADIPVARQLKRPRPTKRVPRASLVDVAAVMPRKTTVAPLVRGEAVTPYSVRLPSDVPPPAKPVPDAPPPRTRVVSAHRTSAGAVIHHSPNPKRVAADAHATTTAVKTAPLPRTKRFASRTTTRPAQSVEGQPVSPSRPRVHGVPADSPYRSSASRHTSTTRQPRGKHHAPAALAKHNSLPVNHAEADEDEARPTTDAANDAGERSPAAVAGPRFRKQELVPLAPGDDTHEAVPAATTGALRVPGAADLAAAAVGRPLWLLTASDPLEADLVTAELGRSVNLPPTADDAKQRRRYLAQKQVEEAYALPPRFHTTDETSSDAGAHDPAEPPTASQFFFGDQVPTYARKWAAVTRAERDVRDLTAKVAHELAAQDAANLASHVRQGAGDGVAASMRGHTPVVRVRIGGDTEGLVKAETDKERAAAAAAVKSAGAPHESGPTSDGAPVPTPSPALAQQANALRHARARLAQLRAAMLTPSCTGVWEDAACARAREAERELDAGRVTVTSSSHEALTQQITSEVIHSILGEQKGAALFAEVMTALEADLLSLALQAEADKAFSADTAATPATSTTIAAGTSHRTVDGTRCLSEREREDEATLLYFLEEAILQEVGAHAPHPAADRGVGEGTVGRDEATHEAAVEAALEAALARMTGQARATAEPVRGRPLLGVEAGDVLREVVHVPPAEAPDWVAPRAITPSADISEKSSHAPPSVHTSAVTRHVGPLHATEHVGDTQPPPSSPEAHVGVTAEADEVAVAVGGDDRAPSRAVPLVITVGPSASSSGGELRLLVDVAPLVRTLHETGSHQWGSSRLADEPARAADSCLDEGLRDVEVVRTAPTAAVPTLPQVPSAAPTAAVASPMGLPTSVPPPLQTSASVVSAALSTSPSSPQWYGTFLRDALLRQEHVQREYIEDQEWSAREAMGMVWQWRQEEQPQRWGRTEGDHESPHHHHDQQPLEGTGDCGKGKEGEERRSHATTRHSSGDEAVHSAGRAMTRVPDTPPRPVQMTFTSSTSSSTSLVMTAGANEGRTSGGSVRDPITRFVLEWLDQYTKEGQHAQQREEVVGGLHAAAAQVADDAAVRGDQHLPVDVPSSPPFTSSLSAPGSSWLSSTSASSFKEDGGHVFVRDARLGADRFIAAARRPLSRTRAADTALSTATTRYTSNSRDPRAGRRPVVQASAPTSPVPVLDLSRPEASTLVPRDATCLRTDDTSSTSRATYRVGSSSFTSDSDSRGRRGHGSNAREAGRPSPDFSPPPAFLYQSSVLSGVNDSCAGLFSPAHGVQAPCTADTTSASSPAVVFQLERAALLEEVMRLQAHQRQRQAESAATLGFEGPFLRQLESSPVIMPRG